MKKVKLLTLLLIVVLLVQSEVSALPYSSHYWGSTDIPTNDFGVTGHVDFAVYNTQGPYGNEWEGAGFSEPGDGQFIYAYQIFCDDDSASAIEYFTIMGFDDPPTAHHISGIDTINFQDPWESYPLVDEGIAPIDTETNLSETRGRWIFEDGFLIAGESSWYLVYSSDYDWVKGKFTINYDEDFPVGNHNPEPGTLALLGFGSTLIFAKRRNFLRSRGGR